MPRKDQSGNEYLEALLRKLNKVESDSKSVKEDELDDAGLYSRKGDMEESYAEQLMKGNNPISYRDELNKDKPEPKDSVSNLLNKNISASKKLKKVQERTNLNLTDIIIKMTKPLKNY